MNHPSLLMRWHASNLIIRSWHIPWWFCCMRSCGRCNRCSWGWWRSSSSAFASAEEPAHAVAPRCMFFWCIGSRSSRLPSVHVRRTRQRSSISIVIPKRSQRSKTLCWSRFAHTPPVQKHREPWRLISQNPRITPHMWWYWSQRHFCFFNLMLVSFLGRA